MTKQEKVATWAASVGFEWHPPSNGHDGLFLLRRAESDLNGTTFNMEQATFFYDVVEQSRLETGKMVAFQTMDGADPKGIYDAFSEALRHLKQEGKTNG